MTNDSRTRRTCPPWASRALRGVGLDARHERRPAARFRCPPRCMPGSRGRGRSSIPASSRSMRRAAGPQLLVGQAEGPPSGCRASLPIRAVAPVEVVSRTILVAVPAFERVEPETTSGRPTRGAMSGSGLAARRAGPVAGDPRPAAAARTPPRSRTPRQDVEASARRWRIPIDQVKRADFQGGDVGRTHRDRGCRSAPSTARVAPSPRRRSVGSTISGGVLKVGGRSAASRTPRRRTSRATDVVSRPPAAKGDSAAHSMARAVDSDFSPDGLHHPGILGVHQPDDPRATGSCASIDSECGLHNSVSR